MEKISKDSQKKQQRETVIHQEYRAPETPKDEEKRVDSSKNNFERAEARDKEE